MGPSKPPGKKQDLQSTGNALVPYCRGTATLESRCGECAGSRPPVQSLSLCLQPDLRALRQYTVAGLLAERRTDTRDVVVIGMSLDDPSITPSKNCRYDLGIAFPRQPGGILGEIVRSRGRAAAPLVSLPAQSECDTAGLSIRDFESQQIVALHCVGDLAHVGRAWQYLYRFWLPSGAFEPADLPAMEIFVGLAEEIGWETFDLETCIPVVRL
jgi:DNA gyrase inhibitor GyrI